MTTEASFSTQKGTKDGPMWMSLSPHERYIRNASVDKQIAKAGEMTKLAALFVLFVPGDGVVEGSDPGELLIHTPNFL